MGTILIHTHTREVHAPKNEAGPLQTCLGCVFLILAAIGLVVVVFALAK